MLLHRPLSLSDEFESTLYALEDFLLFSGFEATTGREPWVSDGDGGMAPVQDIAPGGSLAPAGVHPRGLAALLRRQRRGPRQRGVGAPAIPRRRPGKSRE